MSKLQIITLDKRYNGHRNFCYALRPNPKLTSFANHWDKIKFWRDVRAWCWETWGPSLELFEWEDVPDADPANANQHWAWTNDAHTRKIYLKSDKELLVYKLRWE